jgi:hypothetical protein
MSFQSLLSEKMTPAEALDKSRRRIERIQLSIPVRINGEESKNEVWDEVTRFDSISAFGAGFKLNHKVGVGQLLLLTTPFPTKLRHFDYGEAQYRVWALVRHCALVENSTEQYSVGVAFLGKNPPLSFLENPGKRYLLSNFNKLGFCEISEIEAKEEKVLENEKAMVERRDERYSIPFEVFIEFLDDKQTPIDHDLTYTENVSLRGSAVRTILDAQIDNYVRINPLGYDLSILAIVRNRQIDEDGIPRLHLELLDSQFPLEGIE